MKSLLHDDRNDQRDGSKAFHRILAAVDGSAQANYAVDLASELAREMNAQVVLLHIVSLRGALNPDLGFVRQDLRDECLRNGEAVLGRAKRRLPASIDRETVLREGDPAIEIVAVAVVFDVDLIVIGTHGRGRLASAVLGSVAREVARRAHCPVLTVAHPPKDESHMHDSAAAAREPELALAP